MEDLLMHIRRRVRKNLVEQMKRARAENRREDFLELQKHFRELN